MAMGNLKDWMAILDTLVYIRFCKELFKELLLSASQKSSGPVVYKAYEVTINCFEKSGNIWGNVNGGKEKKCPATMGSAQFFP